MFKELFPIVERAPLMLMITKDGDRLRVHITQKKDDKDDFTPLNLAIAATPEELDAELPMAIAEGAAMLSDEKPKSIADQVKGQVEQAKDAADEGDKKPSKAKKAALAPRKKVAPPKKPAKTRAGGTKRVRTEAATPQITPLLKPEDLDRASAAKMATEEREAWRDIDKAREERGEPPLPDAPSPEAIAMGLDVPAEQVRADLASAPNYKPEPAAAPAPKPDGDTVDLFGGA